MKPKQKHTPTPWKIIDDDSGWIIKSAPTLAHIARIGKGREGIIDAAFIVKAVNCHNELLELLKDLHGSKHDDPTCRFCLAITKAEGK